MIILKDGDILEVMDPFCCTYRGFRVFLNPFFNQVKAKLHAKPDKNIKFATFVSVYQTKTPPQLEIQKPNLTNG